MKANPPAILTVWVFASGTQAGVSYQTLLYVDGSISCDCPGWTKRVDKATGQRSCKHVRFVDTGTADEHAKARKDYPKRNEQGARSTGRKFDFTE